MTDLPIVILDDSFSLEIGNVGSSGDESEVASNTTSDGHPPLAFGLCGPFLDTVHLHGTAELNGWAADIWQDAVRLRGSRLYWPSKVEVVKRTHPVQLEEQRQPPEGIRFIVGAKYYEGHSAYPVEFVGVASLLGIRILMGPSKAGRHTFKVMISPSVLWAIRSKCDHYGQVIDWIMLFLTGESIIPGDSPFRNNEITGAEIHATCDTWGLNWTQNLAHSLVSLREASVTEANKSDGFTVELDNDQPLFAKRFRTSETIYYGNRGTDHRQLCIYNKLLHSHLNGSFAWLSPKWLACGWDGKSPVWRLEVRHGKGWLKDHAFNVQEHFKDCEKTLFTLFLKQVRLVDIDSSRRKRRCHTHPFWLFLQNNVHAPPDATWIWKSKPMNIAKDAVRLTQMAVGCTASLVQIVQANSPNLRVDDTRRGVWSPESVMEYQRAKDHVMHELSLMIDDKILNRRNTPDDIAATINQLKTSQAADVNTEESP